MFFQGRGIGIKKRLALAGATGAVFAASLVIFFAGRMILPAYGQPKYACFTKEACTDTEGGAGGVWEAGSSGCPAGEGFCYAQSPNTNLSINIGGTERVVDLSDYIATVYNYGVGIAAVVAAVIMMIGGLQYLTAGGDTGRVTQAKERIFNAVVGLFLALSAYLILNTVNPDIVSLKLPKVPIVKKQVFAACAQFEMYKPCGAKFTVALNKNAPPKATLTQKYVLAEGEGCIGKSCSAKPVGLDDFQFTCKQRTSSQPQTPGEQPAEQYQSVQPAEQYQSRPPQTTTDSRYPNPDYKCFRCDRKRGDNCDGSGPSEQCCSSWCGAGECTNGEAGEKCESNNECKSSLCQKRWGNSCTTGQTGMPCDDDKQCRGGNVCIEKANWFICVPPQLYGDCVDNSDCPVNSDCLDSSFWANLFSTIVSDKICFPKTPPPTFVKPNGVGARCSGGDCLSGLACVDDAITSGGGVCTAGRIGDRCSKGKDGQCQSGHCYSQGDVGVCVDGQAGSGCDDQQDCEKPFVCDTEVGRSFRCVLAPKT